MSDEPEILRLFDICNRRHYGEEQYVDAAAYAALKARLAEVERERDAARGFVRDLMDEWPDGGDIDQFTVQELATKHGVLMPEIRTAPCGEECHCAEYYGGDKEMAEGVECFRLAEWVRQPDSAEASKSP